MIDSIEGTITQQTEESEPWVYSTKITEKEVTGWLRDKVLSRVGLPDGLVTSWEDSSSSGTCELCGTYSEDIKLLVNGEEVYSGGASSGMDADEYPNPFIALNNWLNEKGE